MRPTLALAGVVAAAASFLAPAAPASAVCTNIVIAEGGGETCTNECYATGHAYESLRTGLVATHEAFEKVPSYWDLFACLD